MERIATYFTVFKFHGDLIIIIQKINQCVFKFYWRVLRRENSLLPFVLVVVKNAVDQQ